MHGQWSDSGPVLRIEAYSDGDLERSLELRQALLLRAASLVERHGAALAIRPV